MSDHNLHVRLARFQDVFVSQQLWLFLVTISAGICIPLSPPQFCRRSGLFAAAGLQLRLPAPPAVHLGADPQSSGVAAHLLRRGARRKRAGRRTRLSWIFTL